MSENEHDDHFERANRNVAFVLLYPVVRYLVPCNYSLHQCQQLKNSLISASKPEETCGSKGWVPEEIHPCFQESRKQLHANHAIPGKEKKDDG